MNNALPLVRSTTVLGIVLIWLLAVVSHSHAQPVRIILDTDMLEKVVGLKYQSNYELWLPVSDR